MKTQRHWTYRPGRLSGAAKVAIRGLSEVNPEAAQIFLTGEIVTKNMSSDALSALAYTNTKAGWPLFEYTGQGTVRMAAFDAKEIWPLLGLDRLLAFCAVEAAYYRATPPPTTTWDFYESLFDHLGLWDTYVPQYGLHSTYLNALTLFRKPMLHGIPASLFFSAHPDFYQGRLAAPKEMLAKRDRAYDNSHHAPTNSEVRFLFEIE